MSDRGRRLGGAGRCSFGDCCICEVPVAEAIAHIFPGLIGVGDGDG